MPVSSRSPSSSSRPGPNSSPTPAALLPLSQKLTSTSSLLLERSRVLSLKLPPSASSQNQIVRNLTTIKNELDRLEAAHSGGGGEAAAGAGESAMARQIREMGEQYDRLLDVFGEDEVGREKGKALRREKRPPTPPPEPSPEPSPVPSRSASPTPKVSALSTLPPVQSPFDSPSPSRPPSTLRDAAPRHHRPYRDDEDEDGPEPSKDADEMPDQSEREIVDGQQMLMEDQDHRLNLLSQSIGRQNHLSIQIGTELDEHHELLEDVDGAMDRTALRLGRARRRLDRVAEDAKQHGSLITIVVLIVVLLLLIIVFKT